MARLLKQPRGRGEDREPRAEVAAREETGGRPGPDGGVLDQGDE